MGTTEPTVHEYGTGLLLLLLLHVCDLAGRHLQPVCYW